MTTIKTETGIVVGCSYMFLTEYVRIYAWSGKTRTYSAYIENDPLRRNLVIEESIAKKHFIKTNYSSQRLDYVWDLYFDVKRLAELLQHIKKGFPYDVSEEDFLETACSTKNTYLIRLYEKYSRMSSDRERRSRERYEKRYNTTKISLP